MANYDNTTIQNPTINKTRKRITIKRRQPVKVTASDEIRDEKRREEDKEKSRRVLAPFPVGVSSKSRRIEGGGLLKRREA